MVLSLADMEGTPHITDLILTAILTDPLGEETFDPAWLGTAEEVFEERIADDEILVIKVIPI